jgi:hypothetical protein
MSNLMAGGLEKAFKHPIKGTKDLIAMFKGKSPALNVLYSTADTNQTRTLDLLLREGLVINTVDDVGSDTFYSMLGSVTNSLDNAIAKVGPVTGSPIRAVKGAVKGIERLNRLTDGLMWDRVYTSMKIQTAMDKMTSLVTKHNLTEREAARMASEFVNDAFGGLNWARLADNVNNRYLSQVAMGFAGKSGRQNMQLGLFAPDWTTANIRVVGKAFANKNPVSRTLYQGYTMRGILMFAIAADAANYALTGHHIWDNQDPTTLELGDGRRMVVSKQLMEPAHWLTKPQQSVLSKMSSVIRLGGELMTGKEWISGPGGFAPPIESYAGHIGKSAGPIWLQQGLSADTVSEGVAQGGLSALGVPIKGKQGQGLKQIRNKPKRNY